MFDESSKERDWLNPMAMSELQRAVKDKRTTVVLNGIEFEIKYEIKWHSKVLNTRDCIRLKRTDGFYAPFAYVSMARILNFEFEDDNG